LERIQLKPDPAKIEVIDKMEVPKNCKRITENFGCIQLLSMTFLDDRKSPLQIIEKKYEVLIGLNMRIMHLNC